MTTPQYVDLQVNGYGGVDFNAADLTAESLHGACKLMREHGVSRFLATVITDHLPAMCSRLRHIVAFREHDPFLREMIAGIHIEGPFLNGRRGYIGAHPADAVQPASIDAAKQLLDAAGGLTKVLTLAPEQDSGCAVTRFLAQHGIVVSAGHTNADLPTLEHAADAGLSMFTHLGNGCPMEMHRHDNIIWRALSLAGRLRIGLIADGVHLPLFVLRSLLKAAEVANCFVVTDAIAAAGMPPGLYHLGRSEVRVGDDCAARSPDGSHLMGSAVTMMRSAEMLAQIGCGSDEIYSLMVANPAKAVGICF